MYSDTGIITKNFLVELAKYKKDKKPSNLIG